MENTFNIKVLAAIFLSGLAGFHLQGCGNTERNRQPRPKVECPWDIDGKRAFELLKRIVALGPRTPGSKAASGARKIIGDQLDALGISYEYQAFQAKIRGLSTVLVNLWARIPGNRSDHVIVIGTHYDTKITYGHPDPSHNFHFDGANDGGSGTALLVEIARAIKKRKNKSTYWLVWFDGEESVPFEWDDSQALFGSRHFVGELARSGELSKVKAMILLDIVGTPGLRLDNDGYSDKKLKNIFEKAYKRIGYEGPLFHGPETPIADDHYPFILHGIPSINLVGLTQLTEMGIWHTRYDTIDRISPESMEMVGNTVMEALRDLEGL